MKNVITLLSLALLVTLTGSGPAGAEIPKTINYQGSLQNQSDGTPVDDTVSMTFALYESAALSDTDAKWTDTLDVTVSNGIYSVVLGSTPGNPLDLPFDRPYYLEILTGDPLQAMPPRQALTAVPYAMKAADVEGITITDGNVGIHTTTPGANLDVNGFIKGKSLQVIRHGDGPYSFVASFASKNEEPPYVNWEHSRSGGTPVRYGYIQAGDFEDKKLFMLAADSDADLALTGGNVGIGTRNPSFPLDVYGATRVTGNLAINTAHANGIQGLELRRVDEDDRTHKWKFWHMTQVYGKNSLQFWEYKTDSAGKTCGGNAADGAMCKARLTIAEGGKVGIGTTKPQYALDVAGTIRGSSVIDSDRRWKEEIVTLEDSLERITQLRGVRFNWKDKSKGEGPQIGVIAQEVEAVFPEVVSTDGEGYKSVSYEKLVAPLLEAVKDLNAENESLAAKNDELERRLEALEAVMNVNE